MLPYLHIGYTLSVVLVSAYWGFTIGSVDDSVLFVVRRFVASALPRSFAARVPAPPDAAADALSTPSVLIGVKPGVCGLGCAKTIDSINLSIRKANGLD